MWADGQTERQDEANSRFSQFCERAHKLYILPTFYTCVFCGSEDNRRFLPYTVLNVFYNLGVFTSRYELNIYMHFVLIFLYTTKKGDDLKQRIYPYSSRTRRPTIVTQQYIKHN